VLRVARNFRITLPGGQRLTCADAASQLAAGHGEVRSAGTGARGQRWYGWSWLATASPQHHLLIRHHLKTGELAFHYCYVPAGQPLTLTRLIRAAGLKWPVEENSDAGRTASGWTSPRSGYTPRSPGTPCWSWPAAICAITAALLKPGTGAPAPLPVRPGRPPPADPGMIALTVPEIARLLAALLHRPHHPAM